jgi:hypothetical protein
MRANGERADQVIAGLTASLQAVLEDPVDRAPRLGDICPHCGCTGDHDHVRTAVEAAEAFLRDLLSNGPLDARTIYTLAEEHGIARRTIERASTRRLRGGRRIITKTKTHGRSWWQLATPNEGSE